MMKTKKQLLSLLLCGAMLFSLMPQMAFAEGTQNHSYLDGLCEHHTEHDDACGYQAGTAGTPCAHEHTDACRIQVTSCVLGREGDGEEKASSSDASETLPDQEDHVCSEETGCITEEWDCPHEEGQHDDTCGYIQPVPGTPCGYVCEQCGDGINAPSQIILTAEQVQEMILELPDLEELERMSEDRQQEIYEKLQEVSDAYEALTAEEQEQLTGTEKLEELLAFFYGMANVLADEGDVTYVSYSWNDETDERDEEIKTLNAGEYEEVESQVQWGEDGKDTSYVVPRDPEININYATVKGDVSLILLDGCHLNVNGDISISLNSSLTIYAESKSENTIGKLTCTTIYVYGGGTTSHDQDHITIHGGDITASGRDGFMAGIGGNNDVSGVNIKIYDGKIKAVGGSSGGAGIGGGDWNSPGRITIYGGEIVAAGRGGGAGIGGGAAGSGGEIFIYGGTITANGSGGGAGIGGGCGKDGGTIVIYNGEIETTGSSESYWAGAGIGGGAGTIDKGNSGDITIYDGKITATGGSINSGSGGAAGIGGSSGGKGENITISGGTINAEGGKNAAAIGGGSSAEGGRIAISGDDTDVTVAGNNNNGGNDIGGGGSAGSTSITIGEEARVQGSGGRMAVIGASHQKSEKWAYDDTQHWHPCEVSGCNNTAHQSTKENHNLDDGTVDERGNLVRACTVNCGYSKALTLTGISIDTPPTTMTYTAGDTLNLTGLVITATYSDGSTKNISYVENNGMTFGIDGTPIYHGSLLNKTNHDGKQITVTYYGESDIISTPLTVNTATLAVPQNIRWDGTTAKWGNVDNASSYTVQLYNGTTQLETKTGLTDTFCTFDYFDSPAAGSYTFTVTAKGTGNYSDSPESAASGALTYYAVTFDTNGGSQAPQPQVVVSGGRVDRPAAPIRTGYGFEGWYSDENWMNKWDFENSFVSGTTALRAKWEVNKYTVTWKNDDGTVLETDNSVAYGTEPSYDGETPTKTATAQYTYTFSGWTPEISNVIGEATYTATYTQIPREYSVTLNTGGGTIAEGQDVTSYIYGTGAPLPGAGVMSRTGYQFAGWYEDSSFIGNAVTEIADDATGNKAFYAKWDLSSTQVQPGDTVRYMVEHYKADKNSNTGYTLTETEYSAGKIGKTVTAAPKAYTGYTHNPAAAGSVLQGTLKTITSASDIVTLRLYYDVTVYTVTVETDGNGTASASPASAEVGTEITLTAAAAKGYRFKAWEVVSGGVTISSNKFLMPEGNVTVKAVFEKSSGGSSGGNSSSSSSSPKPVRSSGSTSAPAAPALPSYVVKGTWTMIADGTWSFTNENGIVYKNTWVAVYNPYANTALGQSAFDWFYFDGEGCMVTGWLEDNKRWYYLNPVSDGTRGRMLTGWQKIDGRWYYFNEMSDGTRGAMMTDAWIGAYYVDRNGVWKED